MTREQIDAIERLEAKATPGPWETESSIDDDNPWLVEAGKASYEWRCLAMVTKSGDDINPTEGSANLELLLLLRNNAKALLAAAHRSLELEEALELLARMNYRVEWDDSRQCWAAWINTGAIISDTTTKHYGATPLDAINNARRGM